jgi:hypothetical protein
LVGEISRPDPRLIPAGFIPGGVIAADIIPGGVIAADLIPDGRMRIRFRSR